MLTIKRKFRRLDSNQNKRHQKPLGCQLPHAGPPALLAASAGAFHDTDLALRGRVGIRHHLCSGHHGLAPALDLLVQGAASEDFYPEAAMVCLAHVQPDCARIVPLPDMPGTAPATREPCAAGCLSHAD